MPKIRIFARGRKFKVFEKRKPVNPQGITLTLNKQNYVLKIPLYFLGDPDFVLVSFHAIPILLPVDVQGFRKVELR